MTVHTKDIINDIKKSFKGRRNDLNLTLQEMAVLSKTYIAKMVRAENMDCLRDFDAGQHNGVLTCLEGIKEKEPALFYAIIDKTSDKKTPELNKNIIDIFFYAKEQGRNELHIDEVMELYNGLYNENPKRRIIVVRLYVMANGNKAKLRRTKYSVYKLKE